MRIFILTLCVLSLLMMQGGIAQARPEVPGELQKQINAAVDKGVAWLKSKQMPEGYWQEGVNPAYAEGEVDPKIYRFGITSLALLALLESDVPTNDPVIEKGFNYLHEHRDDGVFTYPNATYILAAHALCRHKYMESIASLPAPKREKAMEMMTQMLHKGMDRKMSQTVDLAAKVLLQQQFHDGSWRYGSMNEKVVDWNKGDTSSTQFAILGLHYSTEMGIKVKPEVFQKAAEWLLKTQDEDGPKMERKEGEDVGTPDDGDSYIPNLNTDRARGWAYIRNGAKPEEAAVNGGMTTVGICGLIVAKSHLITNSWYRKIREDYNQAIFDGFAWLSANWSVTTNPGGHRSVYYYLYGIERVGMLGGFDYIAGHNWYREGAEVLVPAQRPDGSWIDNNEINPKDTIASCFALLFLKRGTVVVLSGQPER